MKNASLQVLRRSGLTTLFANFGSTEVALLYGRYAFTDRLPAQAGAAEPACLRSPR
ncbi:hypothetical protein ACSHWB_35835 [Lentzea sp. HUAS TT2]|uniref:hypothetical protein n=1 Tax=Lentzea sp. HUAS TT2 TaxID=3447454 RepID=UPI003F6EB2AE